MSELHFNSIEFEGIRFAHIKDYERVPFDELKLVDALIIEHIHLSDTFNILKSMRTHSDRNIYLMPLFLYKAFDLNDKVVESLVDGEIVDLKQLESAVNITQKIIKLAEYG